MQETSFTTTFIAKGFKHAKHNENPDYDLEVKVRGPEMGYITTPICVVNCAMKIVENKKSLPCGVLTPSVAFSNTDIIERLCADGMEFTVVNK